MNRSPSEPARAQVLPVAASKPPDSRRIDAAAHPSESSVRLRAPDPSAVATAVLSPEGRFVAACPAACRLLGLAAPDLLATTLDVITYDADAEAERAARERALSGGADAYEIDKRLVHAAGVLIWVRQHVRLTRGADGAPMHLVWEAREIAAAAAPPVPRAEEWLELVMSSAPIVLWCVDRAGVFTLCEGRGLAAMGLVGGELVGRSALEVFRDVRVVEATSKPTTGDVVLERALAGEACDCLTQVGDSTYDTHLTPISGRGGEVVGVIGVATDMSELMRAETAL
jgi:PAS domain S-box-containing protein